MGRFKFGFCDWKLPVTGLSSLYFAAETGYDGVQYLDTGIDEAFHLMNHPGAQRALKNAMVKTGVEIHLLQLQSIARAGLVKCKPNTTEGKKGLQCVRLGVEACKAIGIQRIMLVSFYESQIKNHHDLENTAAFLKAAGEIIHDGGIEFIYESFIPLADTMELYELTDKSFQLCYDTLNPLAFGFGSPVDEMPQYLAKKMVNFIHFKDTPSVFPEFGPLGTGNGLYKECVNILHQYNYEGWLISENNYFMDKSETGDIIKLLKADLSTMKQDFH